jgi:ribosomal subunit interface protein
MAAVMESLVRRYDAIKPHLTERQRRIWLGSEARELGSGGVGIVADAVAVSPDTVRRGRTELDDPQPLPVGRSRARGGGRKRAEEHDPDLPAALDKLVDPDSRGDPMTPLRWTSKSMRYDVELDHENNPRQSKASQRAAILGHGKGGTVRAEAHGPDLHAALDAAVAKLEAQLRRNHDRGREHHDRHQPTGIAPAQTIPPTQA